MVGRIACLLGRHRWSSTENRQTQGHDLRCRRCGKERHTYPGDPGFRGRTPPPQGHGFPEGQGF